MSRCWSSSFFSFLKDYFRRRRQQTTIIIFSLYDVSYSYYACRHCLFQEWTKKEKQDDDDDMFAIIIIPYKILIKPTSLHYEGIAIKLAPKP
jgi:hypothetical protein